MRVGGAETNIRTSTNFKPDFNNTLKLSATEHAHRTEALTEVPGQSIHSVLTDWSTQVYCMFDSDGDGSVSESEMMRVGQARKELGGRCLDHSHHTSAHRQHELTAHMLSSIAVAAIYYLAAQGT